MSKAKGRVQKKKSAELVTKVGPLTQEEKMMMFWQVSRAYNTNGGMTTEKALKMLGRIRDETGPRNPLRERAIRLLNIIIYGSDHHDEESYDFAG